MDNYELQAQNARRSFLNWDQSRIIERYRLEFDPRKIYIRFLDLNFSVDRGTALVFCEDEARPASFEETMSIYDVLARDNECPGMSGQWRGTNALEHVAQSSPDSVKLQSARAQALDACFPEMSEALLKLSIAPFQPGDAACIFPVFDFMPAVFQFWRGDEEFPAGTHFLWDRNALSYLHYETLYYVMGAFFERIKGEIAEIQRKQTDFTRQKPEAVL